MECECECEFDECKFWKLGISHTFNFAYDFDDESFTIFIEIKNDLDNNENFYFALPNETNDSVGRNISFTNCAHSLLVLYNKENHKKFLNKKELFAIEFIKNNFFPIIFLPLIAKMLGDIFSHEI